MAALEDGMAEQGWSQSRWESLAPWAVIALGIIMSVSSAQDSGAGGEPPQFNSAIAPLKHVRFDINQERKWVFEAAQRVLKGLE